MIYFIVDLILSIPPLPTAKLKAMNVLIVEDHPMIIAFYQAALMEYFDSDLKISTACNCYEAYHKISSEEADYTIAIIDYSLPAYAEENIFSGIDLISLIRAKNSKCKIILITGNDQRLFLYDIFKQTRPEAMATKSNITVENFIVIIKIVLEGNHYTCPTIKQSIDDIWLNRILADEHNRDIIMNLSRGYKVNELHTVIPLAEITIKKRLSLIKKAIHIDSKENLLTEIKRIGLLMILYTISIIYVNI